MVWIHPNAFGWQRDLPDHRDYGVDHPEVREMLAKLANPSVTSDDQPVGIDLRGDNWWSSVKDQGTLQSSVAHACVGLVEYFERRTGGVIDDLSCLFLYKTARQLLRQTGDTGAGIRATLKAICRFGVPSESYAPYDLARYDAEPQSFLYSVAKKFPNLRYIRLDAVGGHLEETQGQHLKGELPGQELLVRVKAFLGAGFPCVFGFPVTALVVVGGDISGAIPFPRRGHPVLGGQAVVAVGFDDRKRVDGSPQSGVLLVRNSWGTEWGDGGYGWLPYQYVTSHLAADFWTFLDPAWLASGRFDRLAL